MDGNLKKKSMKNLSVSVCSFLGRGVPSQMVGMGRASMPPLGTGRGPTMPPTLPLSPPKEAHMTPGCSQTKGELKMEATW